MLDCDLAELYGVENRVLNQAVKRNINRFPEEFMFQLTREEFEIWKSQIVTFKEPPPKKNLRYKIELFDIIILILKSISNFLLGNAKPHS